MSTREIEFNFSQSIQSEEKQDIVQVEKKILNSLSGNETWKTTVDEWLKETEGYHAITEAHVKNPQDIIDCFVLGRISRAVDFFPYLILKKKVGDLHLGLSGRVDWTGNRNTDLKEAIRSVYPDQHAWREARASGSATAKNQELIKRMGLSYTILERKGDDRPRVLEISKNNKIIRTEAVEVRETGDWVSPGRQHASRFIRKNRAALEDLIEEFTRTD